MSKEEFREIMRLCAMIPALVLVAISVIAIPVIAFIGTIKFAFWVFS